jgi:flavin reductase (DIM6/NTAB) family NADH-FMN oxidoreductase RutF/rubredoxin
MNKSTLYKISYGLYVISAAAGGNINGQIANTAFQITSEPATIAVSINKQNFTHELIEKGGVFSISILATETPMPFIGLFGFKSGREIDKFEAVNYKLGANGCPVVLDYTVGFAEAKVVNKLDVGTHTIFVGQITDADILSTDGEPMTYAFYHQVKNGKAPATAPTFISEDDTSVKSTGITSDNTKKEVVHMDKFECTLCGWVYDPELGDPDSGIEPGTPFEDLSEDWVCPVCGASKDQFAKVG